MAKTLSELKDLALSTWVMTDYSITKEDLRTALSDTVGLSSIDQIKSDTSVDLMPYARTSDFDDKVGLSTLNEISSGLAINEYAKKSLLGLKYDSTEKKIYIGAEGVTGYGTSIDASDFIKDGMISSVSYDKNTHKLTITWNTSAGHDETVIDLSGLVDVYTPGTGLSSTKSDDGTQFYIDENVVVKKTKTDISSNIPLGEMFKKLATDLGHNWVEV